MARSEAGGTSNPVAGFALAEGALGNVGRGLVRPECVLATRAGNLYVSDARGGITRIAPDGDQSLFGEPAPAAEARFKPNGFALMRDGSFLFANQGEEGGVFLLARDGTATPYLLEVEGVALPPTNFVLVDAQERVWIAVSTRRTVRHHFRNDTPDGFIVVVDDRGARVAADGFIWTNEFRFDPAGEWLYVNETMGKRLTRLRVKGDGGLGPNETVTEFGRGSFPDGLTFDAAGGMWITCVISNRIIRVAPDGSQQMICEDLDPDVVDRVEALLECHELRGPHVHVETGRRLKNISSLAFGGPDLKTAYLGSLMDDRLVTFQSPVAGVPMAHWTWE